MIPPNPKVIDSLKRAKEKVEGVEAKRRQPKTGVANLKHSSAGGDGKDSKQSQTDTLIQLAEEAELFHDASGKGFADLKSKGHRETVALRSKEFRAWLTRLFFMQTASAPSSEALQKTIDLFDAKAQYEGPERVVSLRVGEHQGRLYVDLGDRDWNVVEIDDQGWRLNSTSQVRFRRTHGLRALPVPQPGTQIFGLRKFLNLKTESDFVLVISWLLAALRNRGPYPILVLTGEQGTAKSTFAKILRSLIDPNAADLRTMPRDEKDLFISANNSHCLVFDNLSGLSASVSDTLCRIATGGGFATRRLYSDDEEMLFDASRPIILNGIEDIVKRSDLADRALFITLEPIPEDKRLSERELWENFEKEKPGILGALLDAVSCGIRSLPNTNLTHRPRMADFALWATACETDFQPAGTFMKDFGRNRSEAVQNVLEGDSVATALRKLLEGLEIWKGTATSLLAALSKTIDEVERKANSWPNSPRSLSGRLKRIATFLRSIGINISYDRTGSARLITIQANRVDDDASLPSSSSLPDTKALDTTDLSAQTLSDTKVTQGSSVDDTEFTEGVDWSPIKRPNHVPEGVG